MGKHARNRLHATLGTTLLACGLLGACSAPAPSPITPEQTAQAVAPTAAAAPTVGAESAQIIGGRLVVRARAVPEYVVDLGFELSGVVKEVLVREGDQVAAGQPIARLDNAEAQLNVEDAEARLRAARAEQEKLLTGATPEQMQRANSQLERARAVFRASQGEVTPADIESARTNLEQARLRFERLEAGPDPEELQNAQVRLEQARAELEAARARFAADKTINEGLVEIAANFVREKQAAYSEIYWANASGRAGGDLDPQAAEREEQAKRDLEDAQTLLENRRVAYEEMRQVEEANITAEEANVRAAELRVQSIQTSIKPEDLAKARSELAAAEARVAKLEGDKRAGELAVAKAQLAEAEANMAVLMADPRTEDLAMAEVAVQRAEVALKQTKLNLEQLTLKAPRAGTITQLKMAEGQVVDARTVIAQLADLSSWRIETDSLSELNVVYIREGDTAKISFYALPSLEITGKVTQIQAEGASDRNTAVTYLATIVPNNWDPRLRWNMSASVEIIPAQP